MDDSSDLQPRMRNNTHHEHPVTTIQSTSLSSLERPHAKACYLVDVLPLELRSLIYELLVARIEYTPSYLRNRMVGKSRASFSVPAIGRTCRKVRNEILSLFLCNRTVCMDLSERIDLDAVYLASALQDLGDGITLIKQLEIQHQVDFFFPTRHSNIATVWAKTEFRVGEDGSIEVYCDFGSPENIGDEIAAGSVCTCPLTKRMKQQCQPPSEASTNNSALARAVHNFLQVMGVEMAGHRLKLGYLRDSTLQWPRCSDCHGRLWYLHGPLASAERLYHGLKRREVYYKGFKWILCPYENVHSMRALSSRAPNKA